MAFLSRRERLLAVGLSAVLGVGLLYAGVVKPTQDRIRVLERIVPEKRSELHDVRAISRQYTTLCERIEKFRDRAATQDPDVQLLPYLERLIERQGLARNATITPNDLQLEPDYAETVVQIALEDISLRQLIDFIRAVETSDVLAHIASLHIRKDPVKETVLDSTVEIHSPRLSQNLVAIESGVLP